MKPSPPPLLLVLGGINMDLLTYSPRFPQAGETVVGTRFLTYAGGKGANQSVAAARMGAKAAMIGRVGDDLFGPQLIQGLRDSGVDVSGVGGSPGASSGIAVINIDASAQNRIIQVPGANHACGEAELRQVMRRLPQASALLLQLELPLELTLAAAQAAHNQGKLVMLDPGPARPLPDSLYRCCDVITPNETEAAALVGFPVGDLASAGRAAQVLLARGARCAVIKLGRQGAWFATPNEQGHVPAFPVAAVDSVAAGDAFNGALAVLLAEGCSLSEALRWAAAAGALAVTKVGAQDSMPWRAEVAGLLGSQ